MKKLPIGIQSIQDILTEGYTYVDKTRFALDLIQNGKHYFLSRPRRFGKSLFLSILEEIFKGNKALFEGCHIAESNYDWQPHPVLLLNFGRITNKTPEKLERNLHSLITTISKERGIEVNEAIEVNEDSLEFRLEVLVKTIAKRGGFYTAPGKIQRINALLLETLPRGQGQVLILHHQKATNKPCTRSHRYSYLSTCPLY